MLGPRRPALSEAPCRDRTVAAVSPQTVRRAGAVPDRRARLLRCDELSSRRGEMRPRPCCIGHRSRLCGSMRRTCHAPGKWHAHVRDNSRLASDWSAMGASCDCVVSSGASCASARLHSSHTDAVRMTRESCARPLWCGCQTRDARFLRTKH